MWQINIIVIKIAKLFVKFLRIKKILEILIRIFLKEILEILQSI